MSVAVDGVYLVYVSTKFSLPNTNISTAKMVDAPYTELPLDLAAQQSSVAPIEYGPTVIFYARYVYLSGSYYWRLLTLYSNTSPVTVSKLEVDSITSSGAHYALCRMLDSGGSVILGYDGIQQTLTLSDTVVSPLVGARLPVYLPLSPATIKLSRTGSGGLSTIQTSLSAFNTWLAANPIPLSANFVIYISTVFSRVFGGGSPSVGRENYRFKVSYANGSGGITVAGSRDVTVVSGTVGGPFCSLSFTSSDDGNASIGPATSHNVDLLADIFTTGSLTPALTPTLSGTVTLTFTGDPGLTLTITFDAYGWMTHMALAMTGATRLPDLVSGPLCVCIVR